MSDVAGGSGAGLPPALDRAAPRPRNQPRRTPGARGPAPDATHLVPAGRPGPDPDPDSAAMPLRCTVLGPVGITVGGRSVEINRPRWLTVLAYLLLNANQVVTMERLIDATWGPAPPATARAQIQSDIHALRRAVRAACPTVEPITTLPGGYRLDVRPEELDLSLFTDRVALARAEAGRGRQAAAADLMREALALWRGPALSGAGGDVLEPARVRLEELRVDEYEWLVDLELALGRHHRLIAELTEHVTRHPLRERPRVQLMLALYRSGRQPDALRVAREGRRLLAEEHGLDPGPALTEMETAILRQDPALSLAHEAPGEAAAPADDGSAGPRMPHGPAQLPPAPVPFAGRAGEVALLVDGLSGTTRLDGCPAPPVLLLHGMPGVGKTALAVHVAYAAAAGHPDGHLYLDLRGSAPQPCRPEHAVAQALRGLGVDPRDIPATLAERAALFRSLLARRRLLVVLDDAGSVDQVQPLVPAAPGCGVVVTSRHLLDLPGALRHRVDPLPPAAALEVLAAHLDAGQAAAEPDAARAVVRACGGHPLALRVAAARVRSGTWLADLADLLGCPRHLLDELAVGGVSVREGLAAAYASLSPAAAQVLDTVAGLPTPTAPDWVPVTCSGLAPREAVRALDELVRCHLLTVVPQATPGPNRYRVHRLVAALVLGADGGGAPADAVTRAAHTWGVLAAEALRRIDAPPARGDGPPVDLLDRTLADPGRWLIEERANLAAVLALARDRDWPELSVRVAAALAGDDDRGRADPPLPAAGRR
ncbi:BTAD domain-containing putative transcriptional regulator [Dactylosporangium sp. NPDC050688]|uniref:AfsR/SARP family transcriptional regulator n=1 Tax=Dactylosporangium sp. NPDC050688 TaxID=3157217 RepID=UPI0033E412C4